MPTAKLGGSIRARFLLSIWIFSCAATGYGQVPNPISVTVDWNQTLMELKTSPTLSVVVQPPLRRGSPVHDAAFHSLKSVGADYVRYMPWLLFPKLGVAELKPPTANKTFWDFSLIDPMTEDFFSATKGHSVVLDFSTIPAWMFKTDKPVSYPANPDTITVDYTKGTELRDSSMRELGDYYARLVSWYTRGGFTDELGKYHSSGHHYKIAYWEVFNEADWEHHMTAKQYTERYDAVVTAIHKVDPEIKFVGLVLSAPMTEAGMVEYFLNHANHRPGIPLDMISYHWYAKPTKNQTGNWQYSTFFDQANRFLDTVRHFEAIRKRLSPETGTNLDEIGTILPTDYTQAKPEIPHDYWNASGALYAYVFLKTARLGIDVVGESQLVGYPIAHPSALMSANPSITMVDWNTGHPNARMRVLELIHGNFSLGDKLVNTSAAGTAIAAQAFLTPNGKRMLLINKRNREITVRLPNIFSPGKVATVDVETGAQPPVITSLNSQQLTLQPFSVCVVTAEK